MAGCSVGSVYGTCGPPVEACGAFCRQKLGIAAHAKRHNKCAVVLLHRSPGFKPLPLALCLLATTLVAQPEDAITALIHAQTDLASNAGQAGDQATVDRLTDDQVLFSSGDGTVQRDEKLDASDAVSRELRRATDLLHGCAPSNRSVLVDPAALFVDEAGVAQMESDFSGGAGLVGDWVVHHTSNVAVTSFTLRAGDRDYLAVEAWYERGPSWRLIGGQTIPLYVDPPVAVLEPHSLDDYPGTYSAGPGSVVVLRRVGDELTATSGAAPPGRLRAEAADLFFTPGLPRGYLRPRDRFRRDPSGHVAGFTRNGIVFARVDPGAAGTAGPAPQPGLLRLRDFTVHHTDDVAVAVFFHDRDTPYFGQTLHQTFRSMETWVRRGDAWKMISSQGRQL